MPLIDDMMALENAFFFYHDSMLSLQWDIRG